MNAKTVQRNKEFLEDVQWLADSGESWWQIANRMGVKLSAIQQRYHRMGVPTPSDLALAVKKERYGYL